VLTHWLIEEMFIVCKRQQTAFRCGCSGVCIHLATCVAVVHPEALEGVSAEPSFLEDADDATAVPGQPVTMPFLTISPQVSVQHTHVRPPTSELPAEASHLSDEQSGYSSLQSQTAAAVDASVTSQSGNEAVSRQASQTSPAAEEVAGSSAYNPADSTTAEPSGEAFARASSRVSIASRVSSSRRPASSKAADVAAETPAGVAADAADDSTAAAAMAEEDQVLSSEADQPSIEMPDIRRSGRSSRVASASRRPSSLGSAAGKPVSSPGPRDAAADDAAASDAAASPDAKGGEVADTGAVDALRPHSLAELSGGSVTAGDNAPSSTAVRTSLQSTAAGTPIDRSSSAASRAGTSSTAVGTSLQSAAAGFSIDKSSSAASRASSSSQAGGLHSPSLLKASRGSSASSQSRSSRAETVQQDQAPPSGLATSARPQTADITASNLNTVAPDTKGSSMVAAEQGNAVTNASGEACLGCSTERGVVGASLSQLGKEGGAGVIRHSVILTSLDPLDQWLYTQPGMLPMLDYDKVKADLQASKTFSLAVQDCVNAVNQ